MRNRTSGPFFEEPPVDRPAVETRVATDARPPELARNKVVTGSSHLLILDEERAKKSIEALANAAGGYVHSLRPERIVVHVPAPEFKGVAASLGSIGHIEYETFEALDVTEDYEALETRIAVLQETHAQLLKLLGEATTVQETLDVRQALDIATLKLEEVLGRRRALVSSLQYSALSVALSRRVEEEPTNDPFPWVDEIGVEHTAWR